MIPSESVIQALTVAVQANPEDVDLRLHLGGLLLQAGRADAALEHAGYVLEHDPAHLEALRLGASAAEAAGEHARAAGYSRLVQALGGAPVPQPQTAPPPRSATPAKEEDPYDLSALEIGKSAPEPEPLESAEERGPIRISTGPDDEDEDDDASSFLEIERPDLRLDHVAGMHEVKRRLEVAFLAPMRNPELLRVYRKSLRGGLMLYGPPGCGKTFIARAVAGELGAKFIAVGLADVLDMWFGESERKLQAIFDVARRNSPCVLFFDEVDAIGQKRSQLRGSAGRSLVNQLLAQMDSVGQNNEGVFVLAATNSPWDVDPALRRPGRFDRMMLVLPPDERAREAALAYHMRERPQEGIDYRWLVARTDEYSGADLAHLCESAAELAMEASLRGGGARPITMNEIKRALKEVRPSTRAWFETARNYAMFANNDGAYDDLLAYIKTRRF